MPVVNKSGGAAYRSAPATPGVRPETDYAEQNALGLAKITGVNPALAASMERAYANRSPHSESLLSGMWNAVSSPFRRTLELVGNIGSAAAEPFRNEEEDENPIVDVWQGLTGQENTRWSDNLVSYGADKDAWTTRVLGLAGDIFLDPTNYLGAGGLGLGRDVVATGAKELGEHATLGLLKRRIAQEGGLKFGGKFVTDADDLPRLFADVSKEELRNMGVADELIDSLSGIAAGNADRTVMRGIDDLVQREAREVGERLGSQVLQHKSLRTLPPTITTKSGMTWKRDELIDVFEKTSRFSPEQLSRLANSMHPGAKVGPGTSGMLGRKAAAALGGVRLKFGVPFSRRLGDSFDKPWLGYRWQTSALPLTNRFKIFGSGEGPVMNKMGDFFRGVSGMSRLDTAIEQSIRNGDDIWKRDDMEKFLRLGFTKFEQRMIDEGRYSEYRNLFGNKAITSFMSASDRIGGLTAHLTPKAQLWRRAGYTGMRAGQEIRNAAVMKKIYREFASQHETDWARASHKLERAVAAGELDGQAINRSMIRYLEGVDETLDNIPEFLRLPAKQMKEMYPRLLKEAKKHGAEVGDIGEVMARRRSDLVLKEYGKRLNKLTSEHDKLTKELAGEQEMLVQELGEKAAAEAIQQNPKIQDLQRQLSESQATINEVLEARKSVDLEVGMMDDFDRMLRHVRPNYPGEKAMPKAYFHRRLTREAREAIRGSLAAQYKQWGRAKQVTAQLERVLAHMDHEEAAAYLRKAHPGALGKMKKIWEDNPFGVYAAYVEDMSEAVYKAQLKGAAEHVMGVLGAVDNGLAMRFTAHVPKEFYPRNIAADELKNAGGIAAKYQNLNDLIDRIHVSIGAKMYKSSHAEGTALWAGREPWKQGGYKDKAEYMHIDDIDAFKEYDRIPTDALEQADETALKESITREGVKEPLIIEFDQKTGLTTLAEGNHRLRAAKQLVEEGVAEAAYLPVRIKRGKWGKVQKDAGIDVTQLSKEDLSPQMLKLLDEAHGAGTNFDWSQFGYVPGDMRPSDLFAVEAGRLGKVGSLSDDEATRLGIALHELNRAKSQAKGFSAEPEVAFKKMEADVDMSQWGRLDVPGLEDFVMHPYMAAEFNKAYQGFKSLPEWRMNWRKFVLGPWKKAATIYFPGFHARNFMGAFYNNMLGGVQLEHYTHSHRIQDVLRHGDKSKWAKESYGKKMVIDGEVIDDVKYRDIATLLTTRGVVGGNSLAVADLRSFLGRASSASIRGRHPIAARMAVGKIGKYQHETLGEVTAAESLMRGWEEWGIRTTNTTENYFRTAAFLRGLEDAAGDTAGARMFTMMRHGDYDELTEFENGIRDIIPFYKWMRTNLPYQIKNIFENPGKQAATLDVAHALVPEEERAQWQSYMKEALAIPMPKAMTKLMGGKEGGGILMAQLPLHDLFISGNEFTSSLFPVIRQVVETGVLKKSLFTGAPLEGKQMVPAAKWMQASGLAKLMQAVGLGEEGPDGQVFFSDREMNIANIFPIFSRARGFLTEDPDRKNLRMAWFISATAGLRPEQAGAEEMNAGEREWYYDVLEPQLAQLREVGYTLPTAYDLGMVANQGGGGAYGGGTGGGAYGGAS